jgi:glycine cleavage system regulatory protein
MPTSLVLTVIGPDRPGLVDAIASVIAARDGNWLESRMSRLAGKFAGILRATVPDSQVEALIAALRALEDRGLTIVVERSDPAEDSSAHGLTLEFVGSDRPGIVREISHVLAQRGVNVEELQTECTSAPMSGEMLFRASARLGLPAGVEVEDLRRTLENLAADLMVDVTLDDS